MANSKKRFSMLALLLMMLFIGFIYYIICSWLDSSGYCFEQDRWLSDEEKIRIVIERKFISSSDYYRKGIIVYYIGEKYMEKRNPATGYSSVEEFMEENPDCCSLNSEEVDVDSYPISWFNSFSEYMDIVIVKYSVKHINRDGNNPKKSVFFINNCGKDYR